MSKYIGKPRCDHSTLARGGSCPGCSYLVRIAREECSACDGDVPCVMHRPEGWVDWRVQREINERAFRKRMAQRERASLDAYLVLMGNRCLVS